jgi:hypothetical protein
MFVSEPESYRGIIKQGDKEFLPLYESKLIDQFNHRYASFENVSESDSAAGNALEVRLDQLKDECFFLEPRYWLDAQIHRERYKGNWFLVYRMITNPLNERTSIASIIPGYPCSHSLSFINELDASSASILCAAMNSTVYDYAARQKIAGRNFNHWIWKQLPLPQFSQFSDSCVWLGAQTVQAWLLPRVLELTYTAWDLQSFAQDCGWNGPPFQWDEERRFFLRCELDAAFFHLYDLTRYDAGYILDTFPIVRRNDEERFTGDYRTKRVILEIYDEMLNAVTTGSPFKTSLNPPPADISVTYLQPYHSLPLMLPQGLRFSQADQNVYAVRIVLSMLTLSANKMEISTLMTACGLLARPERLRTLARSVGPDVIAAWSRSFSDTFDPKLFLPTIDELVRRGELRLEREGEKFIVNRVGKMHIVTDPFIEFDALLALRVESSLTEAERQSILPMASSQEIEVRFKVA